MKKLSEREFEIMEDLWKKGNAMTSCEILEGCNGSIDWKVSSLMTVLARMA